MAPRGGKTNEWVYDELLCFVGSPLFQVPVMTFIEANCLIFDPSREDCKEYRELHGSYSALVTVLLDAFREDTTLTHDQIIKAMVEMSKKADLRQIFKGLFEHILATESFKIFVRIMTQKNIELQQQALMLIMKQLGRSPNAASSRPAVSKGAKHQSTAPAAKVSAGSSGNAAAQQSSASSSSSSTSASGDTSKKADTPRPSDTSAAVGLAPAGKAQAISAQPAADEAQLLQNEQEERILEKAISAAGAQKDEESIAHGLTEAEVERTVALSEAEASLLESEKRKEEAKLVQAVQSLVIGGDTKEEASGTSPSALESKHVTPHLVSLPPLNVRISAEVPMLALSPREDLTVDKTQQSAGLEESSCAEAHRTTFESTWGTMSADDIKKRQEFLRQQREKLLELKRREREKQLESYEQSQAEVGGGGVAAAVSRPKSSRVARAALSGTGGSSSAAAVAQAAAANDEEEKRIAMRRAIANRLKEEILAGGGNSSTR